jgi:acetyl-CoA carboxylase beta subunit
LLTSSGARVQESKSSIAYIFRSQSARERMAKPHPFLRRIILRLGRVTP